MDKLFNKAIVATDIHLGKSGNSQEHNKNCISFIEWACAQGKRENAETFIFMGDWHDNRRSINVSTMNYSLQAFEILSKNFENVYIITGNHDLYYREKRDFNSVEFIKKYKNIKLINEITIDKNVAFVPWLLKEEMSSMKDIKTKYIFGHFELGKFFMNSMVEMPEIEGMLNANSFPNQDYVFSGHFHKRQQRNNVVYIGNCFPHNFSDAGDEERGIMILGWGEEPKFKAWPNQPLYKVHKLSEIEKNPEDFINQYTHLRIIVDKDITYEKVTEIKEEYVSRYNAKEVSMIPFKTEVIDVLGDIDMESFKTVDQIVIEGIRNIEDSNFDPNLLIDIYRKINTNQD